MAHVAASARVGGRLRSDAWHLLAVFVVAFVVLVARRPEAIFRSEFSFEGGSVFYIGTYFGSIPEILFRPYAGYQHLLPRLISFAERGVPVLWAPLVSHIISLGLLAGLAAFLASDRMRTVVPSRSGRIGLAALVVLLPNGQESMGVVGDIQRYIPIYLLALAFAAPPRDRWTKALEVGLLAIVSIAGLFAALMQPLFWWRAWRQRDRYSVGIVVIFAAGALTQLASIAIDGRHPANLGDPFNLARIWAFRTITEGFLGQRLTFHLANAGLPAGLGVVLAVGLTVILVTLWWKAFRPPIRTAIAYVWLVFAVTPVFAQTEGVAWLTGVGAANRYFLIPSAMTALVVFAGFARLRRPPYRNLAVMGAIALAIGIGGDLRLPSMPEQGWAHNSNCIGGPDPCVVPVYEPGDWSIVWPGSDGTWVQPRPGG